MDKILVDKIKNKIRLLRHIWKKTESKHRFIAFSTGKDSLMVTAMLYEAVSPDKPPCVYVHHNLEFSSNLEYLEQFKEKGIEIETVHPHLDYFELMKRGMSFLTLTNAWCVPMLVGTGLLDWIKGKNAKTPRDAVMFRGMSGSEYSHKLHSQLEVYRHLDLPCFNPLLDFSKEEIIDAIKTRYGFPMNPIYAHLDRTYCICCYTPDKKRQEYAEKHYKSVCKKYYGQIEDMLYNSGLIEKAHIPARYKLRKEKIKRHGFIYWHRIKEQNQCGAVKKRLSSGGISYTIRQSDWINKKHLTPLKGHWILKDNEIRFWGVPEKLADVVVKRMMNCIDCGFCMVECLPCRVFNHREKKMEIVDCYQCGKCLRLKFCMGWQHKFWRRIIVDADS